MSGQVRPSPQLAVDLLGGARGCSFALSKLHRADLKAFEAMGFDGKDIRALHSYFEVSHCYWPIETVRARVMVDAIGGWLVS